MFGRKNREIERLKDENRQLRELNQEESAKNKELADKIERLQERQTGITDEDVAQGMRDAIYNCAQHISKNGPIDYAAFGSFSTERVTALSQLVTTYMLFKLLEPISKESDGDCRLSTDTHSA